MSGCVHLKNLVTQAQVQGRAGNCMPQPLGSSSRVAHAVVKHFSLGHCGGNCKPVQLIPHRVPLPVPGLPPLSWVELRQPHVQWAGADNQPYTQKLTLVTLLLVGLAASVRLSQRLNLQGLLSSFRTPLGSGSNSPSLSSSSSSGPIIIHASPDSASVLADPRLAIQETAAQESLDLAQVAGPQALAIQQRRHARSR